MSENWNALRIQLEYFSRPFPRSAIKFANQHREEVAPFLIESLSEMAADPSIANDSEYVLHLYAMHLLALWRDTRAYAPLAALGHHSYNVLENVLGDTITESYGRCLASVCDGNIEPLKSIFEDAHASHWARNAALDAWMVRVLEGDASREELVEYLKSRGNYESTRLQQADAVPEEFEVLDCIVSVATDIGAVDMLESIDNWFLNNLLDTSIADKKWVHERIREPFDVSRKRELGYDKGYIRDIEREMGWWSGFTDAPSAPQTRQTLPIRKGPKIGRNEPCPCGSGKKYKKCHGL
jgi:hypothetical protein